MTCAGGGLIPDWLPEWLHPWLAGSQGISMCGVEWVLMVPSLLVLVALLSILPRQERI